MSYPNDQGNPAAAIPVYIAGAASAPAGSPPAGSTPLGYQQITSTAAAFHLTPIPAGAKLAIVQAEAQAVRWRDDGTAPTASIGMTIPSGGSATFSGAAELAVVQFIAATSGAILNVAYY